MSMSLLRQAQRNHQQNRLDVAESQYRTILGSDPGNADAMHYLGMLLFQQGDSIQAIELLEKACQKKPRDAALLSNFGLLCQETGDLERSVSLLEQALTVDPGMIDAIYNLGISFEKAGRLPDAENSFRKILAMSPGHIKATASLAHLLLKRKKFDEAEHLLQHVLKVDSENALALNDLALIRDQHGDHSEALALVTRALELDERLQTRVMISSLLQKNNRIEDAIAFAESVVERYPERYEAHHALGQRLKAAGALDDAIDSFRTAHRLRRHKTCPAYPDENFQTSRAKLRHDIEQLDYLEKVGSPVSGHREYRTALASLLELIRPDVADGALVSIPPASRKALAGFYNLCHSHRDAEALRDGPLRRQIDAKTVQNEYFDNAPGLVVIDGFLRHQALESLRKYCLESTIWYDFRHQNGYVGAYVDDGFDCPLLLQIAEALKSSLPRIFGNHHLLQLWAYKYDSRLSGIEMHADFAAINVNFWLTPTEASLNPDNGGMIIWDKEAPGDWGIDQYNTYDTAAQQRISNFLRDSGARRQIVPHRQNRVVIFNSDLFHRTDDTEFRPGYENRRINVTMLFGRRADA